MSETYLSKTILVDTLVKTGNGQFHALVLGQDDAAPTAGSVAIYDGLTNAGILLFKHTFTTAVFTPMSITMDAAFQTGLYVDFTTTGDVDLTVLYR